MNAFYRQIAEQIQQASGQPFDVESIGHAGGGCINETVRLKSSDGSSWFLKTNSADAIDMFEAEFEGLKDLEATQSIRVPHPLCLGVTDNQAWLVMEHIPMAGGAKDSQRQLGVQLAQLHQSTSDRFGWKRNNTIGSTPQINDGSEDWIDFFRTHRLEYQFRLAHDRGGRFRNEEKLLDRLEDFFADYQPRPSLLHGDLWSGNFGFDENGTPVIFDPACYYGDHEAEFGIIVMFGGFSSDFYRGYESVLPLDSGFKQRLPMYELYHTLNHFNLFGSSYAGSCQSLIDQLMTSL